MKILISVLYAAVLLSSMTFEAVAKKPSQEELTVISYNIRLIHPKDGANEWKYRAAASPAMIKDYAPDVFGLQEAVAEQVEYMDKALPKYAYVGVGREDGAAEGEHMAIYYNTKTIRLEDWGTYWLSETPDVPSKGWDARYKRTATWALLTVKSTGRQFFYVNTHLDHRGVVAQQKGLELIVERISEMNPKGLPMVLAGDFNVVPENPVLSGLNATMSDARRTAEKKDARATFNGWGTSARTLDYIYHLGFASCSEYETIVRQYEGVPYISDHYPIMARLIF